MTATAVRLGPKDHGRRMSLDDFEPVEVEPGHHYELSRGVITVSEVPRPRPLAQLDALRMQFYAYRVTHPGRVELIAGSGECKVLVAPLESERHPDLALYLTMPPDEDVWSTWIPEIIIEIVSPGSEQRDYVEKREEYLQFGVQEYWIFDSDRQQLLVLRRSRGRWVERVVRPGEVHRTRLLPGFELACASVFDAASAAGN